jgi:hypothetical protein
MSSTVLRVLSVALFLCLFVASLNYYMDLGWFGRFGKLAVSIVILLICVLILIARQTMRKEETGT